MPIVEVKTFLERLPGWELECEKVAFCLHNYGILIFRDPRANEQENEDYVDLMEKYFKNASDKYYAGEQLPEAKPEYHFQVGVTPEKIERARNHYEKVKHLPAEDQPQSPFPPTVDMKWRYMWKIGERPAGAQDDFPQVLPEGFPDWEDKMTSWGQKLLQAGTTAAQMAAIGMGLDENAFTKRMEGGAHLLAPTGSDLVRNDVGATLAGFHYDIAFMTIHGKSRYPGLQIWLRNWKKLAVKIPKGCLLMQAGSTFEHITGGYVLSGYHEVMYNEETKRALENVKEQMAVSGNERILWRVSSTLFSHIRGEVDISPMKELAHLMDPVQAATYKRMTAFEKLMEELRATSMTADSK
jgi:isopenicillin N synthase-like dioxygenase